MSRIVDAFTISAVVFVWCVVVGLGLAVPIMAGFLTIWGLTSIGVPVEAALVAAFPVALSVMTGIIVALAGDEEDPL